MVDGGMMPPAYRPFRPARRISLLEHMCYLYATSHSPGTTRTRSKRGTRSLLRVYVQW